MGVAKHFMIGLNPTQKNKMELMPGTVIWAKNFYLA